ncbi:DUF1905 domain-containing protein [Methylocystis bryophila]|uniref:DUF1905 domain-containing protein n=1 Tax=Methylocystis bryophila TaxID=655015 RepID=A0A1W6MSP3_9HYPH|nr:DUF1905 domain-containing protein [Methylocystis bryophila]ARN80633.1 hypothetical protein B1812_05615 [Methylocystis bryophila]BDV40694.1 hypothetical protein DSM21852_39470 [Methylocystis bryophila]
MTGTYRFASTIWRYPGEAAWRFVTLPEPISREIQLFHPRRAGFGSVKVTAAIGGSEWRTSLFPDKKTGRYLLPIKADVRKKEHLEDGAELEVSLVVPCD